MSLNKIFHKKNKYLLILGILLLCSFFIRCYGITKGDIWADEATTIYYSQHSISDTIKWCIEDVHPPLYNIILNVWMKVFGISEIAGKSLSLLFGVACVLMIFLVGKELCNEKVGFYSAIFLTFSTFNIFYSIETRGYSLLCLLTLFSFFFYIKYLRCTENKKIGYILGYLISSSLLLYTHPFSPFIILTQNLHFIIVKLYRKRLKDIKNWLVIQFILLLSFLPWIPIFLNQIKTAAMKAIWISKPTLFGLNQSSVEYTLIRFAGDKLLLVVFLALIIIFLFKIMLQKKTKKQTNLFENATLLLLWFVFPIFASCLYSLYFPPIFVMRYVIFSSLAFYILVALAISNLFKTKYQVIAVSLILLYSIFVIANFNSAFIIKEEWKHVSQDLKGYVKEGDIVVVDNTIPFIYYYQPDCFALQDLAMNECLTKNHIFSLSPIYFDIIILKKSNLTFIESFALLYGNEPLLSNSIWLVLDRDPYLDDMVLSYLNKTKEINFTKEYLNGKLYHFVDR